MNCNNYKKFIFIIFFIFLITSKNFCPDGNNGNYNSKTFFYDINPFYACSPERIDIMANIFPCYTRSGIFVAIGHQISQNNIGLAQYFSPSGNNIMFARGGEDYFETYPGDSIEILRKKRDIDAQVFNIFDEEFQSIISISPQSTLSYIGFFGYYTLIKNDNETPKISIQIAAPIIDVQHSICGNESIKKTGSEYKKSPEKSILDGMSSNDINYSRWYFRPGIMRYTNISNIELNFSYNNVPSDKCSAEGYLGIIFPTSSKLNNLDNTSDYNIFSPAAGYGDHFGVQYGTTINLFLYTSEERDIRLIFGANLIYLFPNTEFRTFDLKNRPWSRYLPIYTDDFKQYNPEESIPQLQPLANVFTFESRVSPNCTIISTTEFDYHQGPYLLGVGYSVYARQSESITIKNEFPNTVLAPANYFMDPNKTAHPAHPDDIQNYLSIVRTINLRLSKEDVNIKSNNPSEEQLYYLSIIRPADIDKSSATHPAILTGTLYGKIGLSIEEYNAHVGLGGSYRFSHNNAAIEYSSVWIWGEINF